MKILIFSNDFDYHVAAVSWGLRKLGCEVVIWDSGKFPSSYDCSLEIGINLAQKLYLSTGEELHTDFDVVWNRRRRQDPQPMPTSHPADFKVIERESFTFIRNMYSVLSSEHIRWVNPLTNSQTGHNKYNQLAAAKEVGFNIPNTLMSNDPRKVREFYDSNAPIVFKAFLPGGWVQPNGNQNILKTTRVTAKDLGDSNSIKSCPGIFQAYVKKKYDIRVTVIGETIIAAKIDSQTQGEAIDWRYDCNYDARPVLKLQLPDDINLKCFNICKRLGLVFACIDLVLSEEGEYIFLELNEAGQFLWKEQSDPELPLLKVFCNYLANGDAVLDQGGNMISMANFEASDELREFQSMYKSRERKDNEIFIYE